MNRQSIRCVALRHIWALFVAATELLPLLLPLTSTPVGAGVGNELARHLIATTTQRRSEATFRRLHFEKVFCRISLLTFLTSLPSCLFVSANWHFIFRIWHFRDALFI